MYNRFVIFFSRMLASLGERCRKLGEILFTRAQRTQATLPSVCNFNALNISWETFNYKNGLAWKAQLFDFSSFRYACHQTTITVCGCQATASVRLDIGAGTKKGLSVSVKFPSVRICDEHDIPLIKWQVIT